MKNIFYLLFVLPQLFSCGNDASSDAEKETSPCEFVQIQKDMFNDILNGMPIEKVNKKYATSKERYKKLANENNKADFEEFKKCTKDDDELDNLSNKLRNFAIKNRIEEIEGLFMDIIIDESLFE